MTKPNRIVHLKQSGELLTDKADERWTPTALKKAAERIAEVQKEADRLRVAGLMVVSGGGNVPDGYGRGAVIRERFGADSAVSRYADVIGRRSTVDNTIMLAAALTDAGVPYLMLAAPSGTFSDIDLGDVKPYGIDLVQAAYRDGRVVLMAGGIGVSGITTDTGVVQLALWQAEAYPSIPSLALKATKYNGVFEDDPTTHPGARHFAKLSAEYMLHDYDRFSAVDHRCLELLKEAGDNDIKVGLQVYAAEYSIAQALENTRLGTMIYSKQIDPQFT